MKREEKADFFYIANQIIKSDEFQKRKKYQHHENSVYEHSLIVAQKTYLISKRLGLDYKSATIGALLHDFYEEDWQKNKKRKKLTKLHGLVHAHEANKNAHYHYPHFMNKKVSNIIKRHMFPLNIMPPLYLESWIVTAVDKYVSLEILKNPRKYPKYLGLKEVGKRWKKP